MKHEYNQASPNCKCMLCMIYRVRNFTGSGYFACSEAMVKANNDPYLAAGFLATKGLAVMINGDRSIWEKNQAESYAAAYREKKVFEVK